MDKRSKTRSGLYFGIAMAVLFILENLLTHDNVTTKKIVITVVAGLLQGAVAGLLFGWLMSRFVKSKLFTHGTQIDMDATEVIVFETGANHFKGAEGVGGKLYLTNKRLVFKSHKYNIQNHELSINVADIAKVDRYKVLGVANNGVAVTTTGDTIEKFAVQKPDEWINQLTNKNGLQPVPVQ